LIVQKPEIITLDGGLRNADLLFSTLKMDESAQWKRQRIIVLVPSANKIDAKVYLSHVGMIFPPNNATFRMLCLGMEVSAAYSEAIEHILATPDLCDWEYVLTVEHDNTPPPDGVLKLLETMDKHPEYGCVGGLYWTKGEGGVPQIWGDPRDPQLNFRPQPPVPGEVVECCGTGMGFNLWRLSMFKDRKLKRPLFVTKAGIEGVGTQDLDFWSDARKHGYRCAVDCRVLVGHYDGSTGINW
jgi:hypothetical protein